MAPPISHNQPTLDIFLELASEHSTVPIDRTNVSADAPTELPPGGARDTSVTISAVPEQGLRGDRTLFYRRLDLGEQLSEEDLTIIVPDTATSSLGCIDGLNQRLGTGIQPQDIVDRPIVDEVVTFVFAPGCYAYVGNLTVSVQRFQDDTRPLLSSAVYRNEYIEFPLSTGNYDASPAALLLSVVNTENSLSLSMDDFFFDVPHENTNEDIPADTYVELHATDTAAYQSSVTLYYNRLNLSSVYPSGVEVPYGQYANVVEALPAFNTAYGFQLSSFDVVNASLTPTAQLQGSAYSLLLAPGEGPTLSVADSPDPENVFMIQTTDGEDLTTLGGDSWVTVPVTKQPLQDAYDEHCLACADPGGCPPVQTRACEIALSALDDEAATQAEVNDAHAKVLSAVEQESDMTMSPIGQFEFMGLDETSGAFYDPMWSASSTIGDIGSQVFINVNTTGDTAVMPVYRKAFVRNEQIRIGVELSVSFSSGDGVFDEQSYVEGHFYQGRGLLTPFPPLPEAWEKSSFSIAFMCGKSSGGHNGIWVILTYEDGDTQTLLLPGVSRNAQALLVMDSLQREIGIVINGGYYRLGDWTGTAMVPQFILSNTQSDSESLDTRLGLSCYASEWQGSYSVDDLTDINGQAPYEGAFKEH